MEVRQYEHLFLKSNPDDVPDGETFLNQLNPHSMDVVSDGRIEPSVASAAPGSQFQFERTGYFCVDADSSAGKLVFNRTVGLKDSWAKIEKAFA